MWSTAEPTCSTTEADATISAVAAGPRDPIRWLPPGCLRSPEARVARTPTGAETGERGRGPIARRAEELDAANIDVVAFPPEYVVQDRVRSASDVAWTLSRTGAWTLVPTLRPRLVPRVRRAPAPASR
jgi:hypothetical protein